MPPSKQTMSMGTLTQAQPMSLSCQLTPPKGAKVTAPRTSSTRTALSGISKVSRSMNAAVMSAQTAMSHTMVRGCTPK